MSLGLAQAPSYYDRSDQASMRAELEREDLANAKLNRDAVFNTLTVADLSVSGTATFVAGHFTGNLTVDGTSTLGNFTFATGAMTVPTPNFTINGTTVNAIAFRNVASPGQTQNFFWAAPSAGAGVPSFRAMTPADLPAGAMQCQGDATPVTVANNVAANVVLGHTIVFQANSFYVGQAIRMTCSGVYGDAAAAPNLTLSLNSTSGILCTTGANAVGAVSLANRGWRVDVDLVIKSIGATGTVEVQGRARLSTSAVAAQDIDMENTAVVAAFNTTIGQILQLVVTWSAAAAANTITCRQTVWEFN